MEEEKKKEERSAEVKVDFDALRSYRDERGMPILSMVRMYAVSGVSAHGLLLERLFRGMRMKDAVREVSALPGYSRNDVYKASLEVAAFLDGEDE